jgi:hypothetical protein
MNFLYLGKAKKMDIAKTKIALVKEILKSENKSMLEGILKMVKSDDKDFWDELSPYEKHLIDESIQELNEGKSVPYEKVMKKYRK